MNDTSQGAVSPAAAPPRKPRWGAYRSPDVLQRAGAMVRAAREKQRLSLREVAALTGKSHVFLGEIERGTSALPLSLAPRLAFVLDMDLAALLCAFRLVPEQAAEAFFDPDRMRAALAGGGQ